MSDQPAAITVPPQPRRSGVLFWLSLLIFVIGVGFMAWTWYYRNTESYKVRQALSEAEKLADDGQLDEAATIYRNLADQLPDHADDALAGIKKLLGEPLDTAPLPQVQAAVASALSWPDTAVRPELREKALERAMQLLRQKGDKVPAAALDLLRLVFEHTGETKQRQELAREAAHLLEGWAKNHPNDIDVAVAYSTEVLQPRKDVKGIEAVLAPLQARLKGHNGAVVLARSLLAQEKDGEAVDLLEEYCKQRVPLFVQADRAYQRVVIPARDALLQEIAGGKAEKFDYATHDAADLPSKYRMKETYVKQRLAEQTDVKAVEKGLEKQLLVLQVIKQLGELQIDKARRLKDPAARTAMLEKAERTYFSLRGTSADTGEADILLAKAAFLMDKPKEAQKYLDDMLQRLGRTSIVLMKAAESLYLVGVPIPARELLEEAYRKEEDKNVKQEIALFRAQAGIDAAEQVEWLKKSNTSLIPIQFELSLSLARQAEEEGRDEEAVAHLRQALKVWEKAPKDPLVLHKEAMVWLAIFRLNKGEKTALDKGLALIGKAVGEQPENPELLHNAGLHLYQAACLDLTIDGLEGPVLRERDGLDNLMLLYSDRPGREEQASRTRKSEPLGKARELLEKLLTLQPRQGSAYELLVPLYLLNRDVKAMQALAERLKDVQQDEGGLAQASPDGYSAKLEEQARKARAKFLTRWEKLVTRMSDKKASRSQAAALVGLVRVLLRGGEVGDPPDADRVVKLAEEAVALHPCRMTTQKLIDALLYRAHRQLVQADADYKKMAERTKRSLDSSILVALALTRDGPAKSLALANADVVKVCKLLKERSETFPDEPTPWLHAMLQAAHPEAAAKVAQALKTEEPSRLALAITLKLKPLSLPEAIERYWSLKLEGKEKDGEEVLRRLSRRGLALPFDVK